MTLNIKNTTIFSTLLMLLLFTTPAFSHSYHYELQVTNTLQTNDKKQLEALQLSFLYDGDVSGVMLQDQKDLKKLGEKLTSDLAVLGYFTQVKLDGKVLNTKAASKINLERITMKSKEGDYDVLKFNFTLALKSPTTLTSNSELAFFHEDPTEAAILYYENADQIILGDALKESCRVSVKEKVKFNEGEFPQIIKVNCK